MKNETKNWPLISEMAADAVHSWSERAVTNILGHPKSGGVITVKSVMATGVPAWMIGTARAVESAIFTLALERGQGVPENAIAECSAIVEDCADLLGKIQIAILAAEVAAMNREGTRARKTLQQRLAEARFQYQQKDMEVTEIRRLENWQVWCHPLDIVERFEAYLADEVPVADRSRDMVDLEGL